LGPSFLNIGELSLVFICGYDNELFGLCFGHSGAMVLLAKIEKVWQLSML
jgi:hypothetical protein